MRSRRSPCGMKIDSDLMPACAVLLRIEADVVSHEGARLEPASNRLSDTFPGVAARVLITRDTVSFASSPSSSSAPVSRHHEAADHDSRAIGIIATSSSTETASHIWNSSQQADQKKATSGVMLTSGHRASFDLRQVLSSFPSRAEMADPSSARSQSFAHFRVGRREPNSRRREIGHPSSHPSGREFGPVGAGSLEFDAPQRHHRRDRLVIGVHGSKAAGRKCRRERPCSSVVRDRPPAPRADPGIPRSAVETMRSPRMPAM